MKVSIMFMLCLLIIACNGNYKPKKPDNLISKDEMNEILYDLYIINAAKGVNKKLLEANGFMPETYVLTKYNIDSLQFVTSNNYYAFHTDLYEEIVGNVRGRLAKEKEEVEALEKIENKIAKRKRDSINKIKLMNKDSTRPLNTKKLNKKLLNKAVDDEIIN